MQGSQAEAVLMQLAHRQASTQIRRNLQTNMQSALEAMGLLEDSAAPLTNPSAASVEGTSTSDGNTGAQGTARGLSEQPTALDDRPSQAANRDSASAPSTSRSGARSVSTLHELVRAATARHDLLQQRASQAAHTATANTGSLAGVCPSRPLSPSALFW
jgi:hypothetical protein